MTNPTRAGIPAPRVIRTLVNLTELLNLLRAVVADGALSQTWPGNRPWASKEALEELPEDGPWPDYLELHFHEPGTGRRYRLAVETYHGSGGSWEQVGADGS